MTKPKLSQSAEKWGEAIRDAEAKIAQLERERARLRVAVRLMKRQIKDGAQWPGTVEPASDCI